MKKLFSVLISLLVVVLVFSLVRDTAVKISVEKGVQAVTGLKLRIAGLRVGILKTLIHVKKLRLYNPRGYKDKVMMDVPEVYVDYDLPAFFKGRVHLREVRVNLKEFVVVKNDNGELNLDSLKAVKEGQEKRPKQEKRGEMKTPALQIDNLRLKVGKVIYKDYSKGGEPSVNIFNVNIDENYENITDLQAVVSLIVVKTLARTTVARLADFDVEGLKNNLTGMFSDGLFSKETLGDMGETLKGWASGLLDG